MDGPATTLHRELERAERGAGLRPGVPLTDGLVARRQLQIAVMLALTGAALVGVAVVPGSVMSTPTLRGLTLALATVLAVYGFEQDRHLRHLVRLHSDARRVNLAIADALSHCGVLEADDTLLLLREGLRETADRVAAVVAETIGADRVWIRVPGPAGELPTRLARRAVRRGAPLLLTAGDGRAAVAVPVWHAGDAVAVVEGVAPPGVRFTLADVALAEACAAGAVAVVRARQRYSSSLTSML